MNPVPAQEETERQLLARLVRGDTAALENLYGLYRPRLHRFLTRMGCPEQELDEACNDVMYTVWRRAGSYDRSSRVSTWIFGIARNKALKLHERRRRHADTRSELPPEELAETRLSEAGRIELQQWLEIALAMLPDEQRMVLELTFLDGMSYQEIAKVMGCPENTVKTRMFHARRKLKEFLPERERLARERSKS